MCLHQCQNSWLRLWCLTPLSVSTNFSDIESVSWIGGENHRPAASCWQTLSHTVVSSTPQIELTTLVVIGTDCVGSCKSNYHTIATSTTPVRIQVKYSRQDIAICLLYYFNKQRPHQTDYKDLVFLLEMKKK